LNVYAFFCFRDVISIRNSRKKKGGDDETVVLGETINVIVITSSARIACTFRIVLSLIVFEIRFRSICHEHYFERTGDDCFTFKTDTSTEPIMFRKVKSKNNCASTIGKRTFYWKILSLNTIIRYTGTYAYNNNVQTFGNVARYRVVVYDIIRHTISTHYRVHILYAVYAVYTLKKLNFFFFHEQHPRYRHV